MKKIQCCTCGEWFSEIEWQIHSEFGDCEEERNVWRPLSHRDDYKRMPKSGDFRCLFDDGTECNYSDFPHPFAVMTHWKYLDE